MAMKHPRSWVVGDELNRDIVSRYPGGHRISHDGVEIVVLGASGTPDDGEL